MIFGVQLPKWIYNRISLKAKQQKEKFKGKFVAVWVSKILLTLLYNAELWPLTAVLMKRLDAAHHRWQRRILDVSWKDMVTNEGVRTRTGQWKVENILKEQDCTGLVMWYGWITTPSTILGGSEIPERTRSARDKLERHCQEKLTKIGTRVGRGRDNGPWQRGMASECGPLCPHARELNQGNKIAHLSWSAFLYLLEMEHTCMSICVADCSFSESDKMFDIMYMIYVSQTSQM